MTRRSTSASHAITDLLPLRPVPEPTNASDRRGAAKEPFNAATKRAFAHPVAGPDSKGVISGKQQGNNLGRRARYYVEQYSGCAGVAHW
eukprot:scaffold18919_cov53-Phaeocystis_antarctica.AAC.2